LTHSGAGWQNGQRDYAVVGLQEKIVWISSNVMPDRL
jgi:hypothetical protein